MNCEELDPDSVQHDSNESKYFFFYSKFINYLP